MEASKMKELHNRVRKARSQIEKQYEIALETIRRKKERMNYLENRISLKNGQASKEQDALQNAMDDFDVFTDSQIQRSQNAWKKFEELKNEADTQGLTLAELDDLRLTCIKSEKLATDLLCYSMGLVR